MEIMRFLRFCDYGVLNENDSLSKIRPFLEYVQQTCKTVYTPKREICIGESLLLYKGRVHFRRYIPSKRARYGILSYCLCESNTGYTWNIEIAAGRDDTSKLLEKVPEPVQNYTFSEKIVIVLIQELLNRGYHLYVDNFLQVCAFPRFCLHKKL